MSINELTWNETSQITLTNHQRLTPILNTSCNLSPVLVKTSTGTLTGTTSLSSESAIDKSSSDTSTTSSQAYILNNSLTNSIASDKFEVIIHFLKIKLLRYFNNLSNSTLNEYTHRDVWVR